MVHSTSVPSFSCSSQDIPHNRNTYTEELVSESALYGMQMSLDVSTTSAIGGDGMSHDGPHTATPPVCCLYVHMTSI